MPFNNIQSRSVAFAAICQAAYLVDKIATKGICPDAVAFNASLKSILRVDSAAPLEIFGGYESLEVGFKSMIEQLDNASNSRNMQVTKYIIGMITLEKKLSNDSGSLNLLGERINQVQRQLAHFEIDDSSVLANLDSIYKDLISTLGPKIQINGNPSCLQQEQ
ncbi:MAG: lysogenization regulator HflD, partial [Psychromonas sp.]